MSQKRLSLIQEKLNNRPRKGLGYLTPNEFIQREILAEVVHTNILNSSPLTPYFMGYNDNSRLTLKISANVSDLARQLKIHPQNF